MQRKTKTRLLALRWLAWLGAIISGMVGLYAIMLVLGAIWLVMFLYKYCWFEYQK